MPQLFLFPSVAVKQQFAISSAQGSITLPQTTAWQVINLFLNWTSSAVAGNRLVAIIAKDVLGNVLWQSLADAVQAASITGAYSFQSGLSILAVQGTSHTDTLPAFACIPPGGSITVKDLNNIDSVGDTIPVLTMEYDQMG
jgi:hypothetical protein